MIQQIKALFNKLDIATETTIAMGNVTAEMFLLFDLNCLTMTMTVPMKTTAVMTFL